MEKIKEKYTKSSYTDLAKMFTLENKHQLDLTIESANKAIKAKFKHEENTKYATMPKKAWMVFFMDRSYLIDNSLDLIVAIERNGEFEENNYYYYTNDGEPE